MALIEDLYADILEEPDDLEQVEEGGVYGEQNSHDEDQVHEGEEAEKKEDSKEKKDEKKKRKTTSKPKLNILRLMDKNGLTAIENLFKDVQFKGKGYEREDLNLIMRKMEIWAHQLYPSLQFDDCLGKLEKLGNNKSVGTYVKKIRMGLEDNVHRSDEIIGKSDNDDDDDDVENISVQPSTFNDDAFDQLINTGNRQAEQQPTSVSSELTAEQRERMLKNRLIAEQRRMARMKARQEQQLVAVSENTHDLGQETFNDRSLVSEQCAEAAIQKSSLFEEPSLMQTDLENAYSSENIPQPHESSDSNLSSVHENSRRLLHHSENGNDFTDNQKLSEKNYGNDEMLRLEDKLLNSASIGSVPCYESLNDNNAYNMTMEPEPASGESANYDTVEDNLPVESVQMTNLNEVIPLPEEPMLVDSS